MKQIDCPLFIMYFSLGPVCRSVQTTPMQTYQKCVFRALNRVRDVSSKTTESSALDVGPLSFSSYQWKTNHRAPNRVTLDIMEVTFTSVSVVTLAK